MDSPPSSRHGVAGSRPPAPQVPSPSQEPGPGQLSAVAGSRVVTIKGSAVRRALCQGAAPGTLLGVSWLQPGQRSFLDTVSQEQAVDRLLAWEIMCPGDAVEHGKLGGRLLRDCALYEGFCRVMSQTALPAAAHPFARADDSATLGCRGSMLAAVAVVVVCVT